MKISLLHPSRNRPFKAHETYKQWINLASDPVEIEHILSLDTSDQDLHLYRSLFHKSTFVINDNHNLVEATNNGAKETAGDIIVLLSDDFECFPGWDKAIINAYTNKSCCVLKVDDGCEAWIATLPIVDRAYYESKGYIYHPAYQHLFADTEFTHVATLENKLITRNDLKFKHVHPMYDKTVKMDEVYKKSQSSWNSGKEIYLNRVRKNFDLKTICFQCFNDCEAAKPHIEWLKKELQQDF